MRAPTTDRGRLLLVLAAVTAVTAFTATVPLLRDWFDLRVYHGAVDTWVHHGGRLYDYRVPGTTYGFTYPPFAAVAMLPMALFDLRTAIAVGLLLNLAALAVVVRLLTGRAWRRHGWYGCALGACVLALFEPLRDTFSFGQVNLLLLALVLVDAWLLATGRGRRAGVGIGLAAAVKLTPALFIGLLLVAKRWRAAAVATVVALSATGFAAVVAPDASRFYWTDAMWDTTRVGRLDYVSNQSLQGILARLGEPDRAVWAVAVVLTLGVWAVRGRRAVVAGDWAAAFALTGLTACLVSPITWVHHLVWLLPSFAVLVRTGHLRIAGALYAVLCTSVVWLWFDDASGIDGFLGSNTYTWITLGLLLWLPVGQPRAERPTRDPNATAIDPAPIPAAPRMAQVSSQPGPSSSSGATAAATGTASGPGRGLGLARSASSEPTGSTRPAEPNPQSSSRRASS
ncbi:alpha-1,2-mannosyltransferase [Streptomyces sp. SAI-144]|uniref:glycosyltransferase 87 family protein n=1 Tax=unclassified Streptomyces TaxID=2593676 RepID=UPI0024758BFC|nr:MULTISPECIES: glycosyltransferase 87 family protein [unclassified Streptomyces]MDH6432053.1 alpha-1,2-mannosyltransferase [Streptomyces sp. SAI-144]MDH6492589.1 alpha-1,2-mannosyltransferase [Streptomyces sp. SAI-127]